MAVMYADSGDLLREMLHYEETDESLEVLMPLICTPKILRRLAAFVAGYFGKIVSMSSKIQKYVL